MGILLVIQFHGNPKKSPSPPERQTVRDSHWQIFGVMPRQRDVTTGDSPQDTSNMGVVNSKMDGYGWFITENPISMIWMMDDG